MKIIQISLILALSFSFEISAHAAETNSLSTSPLIAIRYLNAQSKVIGSCAEKKATFGSSYVSIGINKLTVNRTDTTFYQIFNSKRRVFPAATFRASYNDKAIRLSQIGKPVLLSGENSSVDLGVEWAIFDRIPWIIKSANLELRIGYSADSKTDEIAEAFSSVTSAFPAYSLSTSVSAGMAVAGAVDKLLFASGRTINLLQASRDIPLLAGQLCQGYYAVFSAKNSSTYEKYYGVKLVWTGNDLQYDGKSIKDASYAVMSVSVSDRFYDSPDKSFNDNSKVWTQKYAAVSSLLSQLAWASTVAEVEGIEKNARSGFLEAHALLDADGDLIAVERNEIHSLAQMDAIKAIEIAKTRIVNNNSITRASTQAAIEKSSNNPSVLVSNAEKLNMNEILKNPASNIPEVQTGVTAKLQATISSLEKVIGGNVQ